MRSASFERFNSDVTENEVVCANCLGRRAAGDTIYDERMGHYLCDRTCFDEWHDNNIEIVGDYYFDMNVGY